MPAWRLCNSTVDAVATFVHLTAADNLPKIRRNGIAVTRLARDSTPDRGVFAMPVTANFYDSHQWLRELARRRGARVAAVYFRIDDHETVYAGRYNAPRAAMTAVQATALVAAGNVLGLEIVIPHRISPSRLMKTKALPVNIGWRYYPECRERTLVWRPPGEFGAKRFRLKQEETARKDEADAERYYFSRFPREWYATDDSD